MSKLDYFQQKNLNPADELREILASLEERQPQLKSLNAEQTQSFLLDLNRLDTLFRELELTGLDLLPEQGRFQSLQSRLQQKAALLLKLLGGPATLSALRPAPAPPAEKWWWHLDQLAAAQRQRLLRQVGLIVGAIVLFVGGLVVLFQTILAPSPEVLVRLEAENKAYEAIDNRQYQAALASVEEGLAKVPGDAELLILQGVLQEVLGEDAAAAFDQARALLNDSLDFYLTRSQLQLRVGQPVKAEADARAALELDQNSAKTWFLLGQTLEAQDKLAEAVPAYQKASELAVDSGDGEIVVMARLALGRIGASP
ncbi:MAG: tetratricopeptide repeat protein [Anaerolineales bacterium]|nr:tetratricopeptide repeat protein [Anaerolineales bacterium]